MRQYTVLLTPDTDEGGYSVRVPALPGLHTQADTYADAIEAAKSAIAFHLECLEAEGEPIPEEASAPQLVSVAV